MRKRLTTLSIAALGLMISATACKKEEEQPPAQYPPPQQYPPQPTQPTPQPYPPTGPAQPVPATQQPTPAPTGQPNPNSGTNPLAFPCQSDAQCLTHKCNVALGRCAWPCQSDADCVAGNQCVAPACVPAGAVQQQPAQ